MITRLFRLLAKRVIPIFTLAVMATVLTFLDPTGLQLSHVHKFWQFSTYVPPLMMYVINFIKEPATRFRGRCTRARGGLLPCTFFELW